MFVVPGNVRRVRNACFCSSSLRKQGRIIRLSRYRDLARLRRASDRLPTAGSLFFACPKSHGISFASKVTQRKGTPAWRWPDEARPVREGRPGFSTGLLPRRKGIGVPADPPAGLIVRPSPPAQGAREVKSQVRSRRLVQQAAHRVARLGDTCVERLVCRSAPCARPQSRVVSAPSGCRAQGVLPQR